MLRSDIHNPFSGYGFSFYEDVLMEQQERKNGQRKEKYGERII